MNVVKCNNYTKVDTDSWKMFEHYALTQYLCTNKINVVEQKFYNNVFFGMNTV